MGVTPHSELHRAHVGAHGGGLFALLRLLGLNLQRDILEIVHRAMVRALRLLPRRLRVGDRLLPLLELGFEDGAADEVRDQRVEDRLECHRHP